MIPPGIGLTFFFIDEGQQAQIDTVIISGDAIIETPTAKVEWNGAGQSSYVRRDRFASGGVKGESEQ